MVNGDGQGEVIVFPYYKVYFKLSFAFFKTISSIVFPYYKVYFKLDSGFNGNITLENFHTIKSILN